MNFLFEKQNDLKSMLQSVSSYKRDQNENWLKNLKFEATIPMMRTL